MRRPRVRHRAISALHRFLGMEASGGLVLVAAALIALIVANSPLAGRYHELLAIPLGVRMGTAGLEKPLLLWINDGMMAVFFLLVSLEIKREVLHGQLSKPSQVAMPLLCAIGGMAVPALIYVQFNPAGSVGVKGWPIPTATDIAFALGILLLLGKRVPIGLKVLLTTIAVIDDLGAIVLIAALYTQNLAWEPLAMAAGALAGAVALNRLKVSLIAPYMLLGVVMWVGVLKSGVHATLAGVLLGLTIPITNYKNQDRCPLEELEAARNPWVAYMIVPVFAFANAGIPLQGLSVESLISPVPLGIAAGLIFGKTLGVFGMGAIASKLGIAKLPSGVTYPMLFGTSILCGIGFTMSLFIGALAFESAGAEQLVLSRLGILAASTICAVVGYFVLKKALKPRKLERGPDQEGGPPEAEPTAPAAPAT